MIEPDLRGHTVLVLHAHPDDEAIFTGHHPAPPRRRRCPHGPRAWPRRASSAAPACRCAPARPSRSGASPSSSRPPSCSVSRAWCCSAGATPACRAGPSIAHPRAHWPWPTRCALARHVAELADDEGAATIVHDDEHGIYGHPDHNAAFRDRRRGRGADRRRRLPHHRRPRAPAHRRPRRPPRARRRPRGAGRAGAPRSAARPSRSPSRSRVPRPHLERQAGRDHRPREPGRPRRRAGRRVRRRLRPGVVHPQRCRRACSTSLGNAHLLTESRDTRTVGSARGCPDAEPHLPEPAAESTTGSTTGSTAGPARSRSLLRAARPGRSRRRRAAVPRASRRDTPGGWPSRRSRCCASC